MFKHGDLMAHRRLFEGDQVRLFIGRADQYEDGLVTVGVRGEIGGSATALTARR